VAELGEAGLSWGVWADGVRKLAERRLQASAAEGFAVLDDPGYARALRMGAWFDDAAGAARTALEAAGGGTACVFPDCPCAAVNEQ
jgi:hypothetical protein